MPRMTAGQPRAYRAFAARKGLVSFRVAVQETDLWIQAAQDLTREARELILECRGQLEGFIANHPEFARTLKPWPLGGPAPPMVRRMVRAGELAGVGPMAAVAGAVAQHVGLGLASLSAEVLVENGGDVFVMAKGPVSLGIFAGDSPLKDKLALTVDCQGAPLGVCTSSGAIGHSLSLGRADAVVVTAQDCALADAAATAAANQVQEPGDVAKAVEFAKSVPGILGVVALAGDRLAAWGGLELSPAKSKKP